MTDLSADPSPPLAPAEPRGGYDPGFFQLLDDVEDRHFWFRAQGAGDRGAGAAGDGGAGRWVPRAGGRVREWGRASGASAGVPDGPRVRDGPLSGGAGSGGAAVGVPAGARGCAGVAVRDAVRGDRDVRCPGAPRRRRGDSEARALAADAGRCAAFDGPADPSLWSYFDTASRHCRRYTPASLAAALSAAGFRVEYRSQFMAALFPLVWAGRRAAAWKARLSGGGAADPKALSSSELRVVPGVNGALVRLLSIESAWIGLGGRLPIGTSLAVIARPQGP